MIVEITDVQLKGGYRLHLRFEDGVEGTVDISEVIPFTGVFEALKDQRVFDQVSLDSQWGTIRWPNELDLAPEPLYERIAGHPPDERHGLGRAADSAGG